MILLNFILGFLFYCLATILSYNQKAKEAYWFFPVGIILGILINFLWLGIAKETTNNDILIKYALYWDIMAVLIYSSLPIVFLNVSVSITTLIGLFLSIVGVIFIKIG